MAPTEAALLNTFLLPHSSLSAIISFDDFQRLFPPSLQTHPQVSSLYRELQHQRAVVTDQLKINIKNEVRKGERQQREVARARKLQRKEDLALNGVDAKEVDMEVELFGPVSNIPISKPHTIRTLLPEMEEACGDIEAEIEEIEADAAEVLANVRGTIGDLSDLRYGRFNKPADAGESVGSEVLEALQRLDSVCSES